MAKTGITSLKIGTEKLQKKKPTETYFCVDTKYWKFKGGDPDPYGPQRGSTTAEYTRFWSVRKQTLFVRKHTK